MKKIVVTIEKLDHQGRGIANINGKIVFVPFALPGEKVEIEIIKEYPRYFEAKIIKIIKPSLNRVEPKCIYYETCGGCDLQHMKYIDTINYKKEKIINIIQKYSDININPELVLSTNDYNYRNKISLKIIKGKYGFYENKSNKLIEIKRCEIVDEAINSFLSDLDLLNIKNGIITVRVNNKKELLFSITSTDKIDISIITKKHNISGIIKNHQVTYGSEHFLRNK
jgi:23S rRNA (uracil1939-C5)-methyltransferase